VILAVRLVRRPIEIEPMLPSPDEYNTCAAAGQEWEGLLERRARGEDVSDEQIAAARARLDALEQGVVDKQRAAVRAYGADYEDICARSVPPVLEELADFHGIEARWSSRATQLLSVSATRAEFESLLTARGIERISYDIRSAPALKESIRDIRADKVHAGDELPHGYTGSGVAVAVVDDDIIPHPRLPDAVREWDFTSDGDDYINNPLCSEHATAVGGVIFCQPDTDGLRGVAYGAALIDCKTWSSGAPCGATGGITWLRDMSAFEWATNPNDEFTPDASIINRSLGIDSETQGDPDHDTEPYHIASRNADWFVYARSVSFVQAAGNGGEGNEYPIGPPSGGYNLVVGAYDDRGDENGDRSNNIVWFDSSRGPTDDLRRKPDLCAPGVNITSTVKYGGFSSVHSGTSYAAPHVAGAIALLLEARPSLTPRQVHAILIASADFVPNQQTGWHDQAGWGMLGAHRALKLRYQIRDDQLASGQQKTYQLPRPQPGERLVVVCAWQRAMASENSELYPLRNLDLYLDRKQGLYGSWTEIASSISDKDNLEVVWTYQAPHGDPQYDYRVRVRRVPDNGVPLNQPFTLCGRPLLTREQIDP